MIVSSVIQKLQEKYHQTKNKISWPDLVLSILKVWFLTVMPVLNSLFAIVWLFFSNEICEKTIKNFVKDHSYVDMEDKNERTF